MGLVSTKIFSGFLDPILITECYWGLSKRLSWTVIVPTVHFWIRCSHIRCLDHVSHVVLSILVLTPTDWLTHPLLRAADISYLSRTLVLVSINRSDQWNRFARTSTWPWSEIVYWSGFAYFWKVSIEDWNIDWPSFEGPGQTLCVIAMKKVTRMDPILQEVAE